MPCPFFAEIGCAIVSPPKSSTVTPWLQEILFHLLDVRRRQIDLVDRDDHRHTRVPGVTDRLHRLRHDLIVGGDDQHHDIGDLGPAGAHRRERLVAGRVEEGDPLTSRQLHVIRADVLGDPAGLAGDHVRLANVVQQRGLAVVHVAHHGDDRRPGFEVLGAVLALVGDAFAREVLLLALGPEAEGAGNEIDLVEVQPLVHRDHHAQLLEAEGHDVGR